MRITHSANPGLCAGSCPALCQVFPQQCAVLALAWRCLLSHLSPRCKRGIGHPCNLPERSPLSGSARTTKFTCSVMTSRSEAVLTCCASSRVGANTSAWQERFAVSSFCRMVTAKVAVLPVPDWAWAMTSQPVAAAVQVRQLTTFTCTHL